MLLGLENPDTEVPEMVKKLCLKLSPRQRCMLTSAKVAEFRVKIKNSLGISYRNPKQYIASDMLAWDFLSVFPSCRRRTLPAGILFCL